MSYFGSGAEPRMQFWSVFSLGVVMEKQLNIDLSAHISVYKITVQGAVYYSSILLYISVVWLYILLVEW